MGSVNNPVNTTTYDLNKFTKTWMIMPKDTSINVYLEYTPEKDEYVILQAYIKSTSMSSCEFTIYKTDGEVADWYTLTLPVQNSSTAVTISTPPLLLKKGVSYQLLVIKNASDTFSGKGGALLVLDDK